MANYSKYLEQGQKQDLKANEEGLSGLAAFVKNHKNNEIGWDIIKYIKKESGLLVFAKGIMCKEDARCALENGVDGIYVSNHGARQLDTTPATIEILGEVVNEVELFAKETKADKVPVWFDGGIRSGADVLKAYALGADLIWIGRPVLWALSCQGQKGVENMLRMLNEEFKEAMLQCGCYDLNDIRTKNIVYKPEELLFPRM